MSNFWWVNQGATYAWESELNILWAPLTASNGRTQSHWERMDSLAPGDIVFNYADSHIRALSEVLSPARRASKPYKNLASDAWGEAGREVSLRMHPLESPLNLQEIPLELRKAWKQKGSPFNKHGGINQAYLLELPTDAGCWIMDHLGLASTTSDASIGSAPDNDSEENDELFIVVGPDGQVTAAHRPEHARLKKFLFGHSSVSCCALCGKELPTSLLVASHIKKRSHSDSHERGDLHIVMAACALGCDAVYERGYITVDTHGLVQQGPRIPETNHLQSYINDLLERQVTAHTPRTAKYFEWHRDWHHHQLTRATQH